MTSYKNWPILVLSQKQNAKSEKVSYQKEIFQMLETKFDCTLLKTASCAEAAQIFQSRADLGGILVCYNISENTGYSPFFIEAEAFMHNVYKQNEHLPLILLTNDAQPNDMPSDILDIIDDFIWINSNTLQFLAGRIADHLQRYLNFIYPKFFGKLIAYADKYKYAWHTPGHMGGAGFLRSPAGTAFYKYYGENTLRSDLSISVSELGSLLDHSGVTGEAEKNSAKVFGADQTYYVLNGTSNANQIIWTSQVGKNDLALLDRNCHKSLNYAMVRTDALPVYMTPRRNHLGIIGPVRLSEFTEASIRKKLKESPLIDEKYKEAPIRMMALTNSTYDGLCYNVKTIRRALSPRIERLHFDEAWFAYANFHPIYAEHYGLAKIDNDEELKDKEVPLTFCSQSTHKLLTALSQSSMLHIHNGSRLKVDPVIFNESYMMFASTSPQYSMIASLDTATKMMQDQGYLLNHRIICDAIEIRKKMAKIYKEAKERGEWAFKLWQPEQVEVGGSMVNFEDMDTEYLASHQEPWILSAKNNWHNFKDIEDNYVMLDPIKLTITTPGISYDGRPEDFGVPASIVARFLIDYNIVCEKSDYYSFLLLNSIGTDRAKQGALLTALFQFRHAYKNNASLSDVLPELAEKYPHTYGDIGLADHCQAMHKFFSENKILEIMQSACEKLPEPAITPHEAYEHVVRGDAELVDLHEISGRIPAVMVVPYPPGIPIIMGGEKIKKGSMILKYLTILEKFENTFPGYESEIHGVERYEKNGRKFFRILCLKKQFEPAADKKNPA